jgi:hypothetical protein
VSETQQGWECPRCHTVHAPWKPDCDCQSKLPVYQQDCNCSPNYVCMSVACPRALRVTCSDAMLPVTKEEIDRIMRDARDQLPEEGED